MFDQKTYEQPRLMTSENAMKQRQINTPMLTDATRPVQQQLPPPNGWLDEQGSLSNSQALTDKEREIETRINRIENFLSQSMME